MSEKAPQGTEQLEKATPFFGENGASVRKSAAGDFFQFLMSCD
jgi:hypothetical protein